MPILHLVMKSAITVMVVAMLLGAAGAVMGNKSFVIYCLGTVLVPGTLVILIGLVEIWFLD